MKKNILKKLFKACFILWLFPLALWGQNLSTVTLSSDIKQITEAKPFTVNLTFTLPDGWHTYGNPPGDVGMPASIKWQLPPGFTAGPLQFPPSETLITPPFTTYGYEKTVTLKSLITPPKEWKVEEVKLSGTVSWLICKESCRPEKANAELILSSTSSTKAVKPGYWLFVLTQIGFAFLGGMILNLMPCVFPVLSLKVLGFVQQASQKGSSALAHAAAYTGGVLVSFWALAASLIALRVAGSSLGWGFQLQSPAFVTCLILLLWIVSLNFFGIFETGVRLTSLGQVTHNRASGSFFTGVLATLVAAPCTAPFMGSAVGFALAQPYWIAGLVFTALALGMATPYVVLAAYPAWLRFLPKPGAWMETFKQFLGFPLIATVLWLLWVLGKQTSLHEVLILGIVLWGISLGTWLYGRLNSRFFKAVGIVLIIGLASWALMRTTYREPVAVRPHATQNSLERLEALRQSGAWIFVDVSAAWCLTCQVNESLVLQTSVIKEAFKKRGIQVIKLDWTDQNPGITQFLATFHRSGVPFYVLYPGKGAPIIFPEILTTRAVTDRLNRVR